MKYADRIVGLRDGQKVFEGTPDDLDETARGQIYRGEEIPDLSTGAQQSAVAEEAAATTPTVEGETRRG